ncbi:MAG: hypothetical protein AABW48_01130 [Nanoarchaeota archaeon]
MQEPRPQETPLYVLPQSKSRTLFPKIVSLVILGIIFYLGILLNIYLLELGAEQETIVKLISLILFILIVVSGIIYSVYKAYQPYNFYRNRITLGKEAIYYVNITNTAPHQDPLDKLFHSYSINLSTKFFLRHIPEQIQLQSYLQQLIDYAKRTQF